MVAMLLGLGKAREEGDVMVAMLMGLGKARE
jgi:hypothetical protein